MTRTRSFRRHLRGLLVGTLLAASVVMPLAHAATGAGCAAVHKSGKWSVITAPAATTPGESTWINSFGVAPWNAQELFVLHGNATLLRTTDGGCSWSIVLDLNSPTNPLLDPAAGRPDPAYRISELLLPTSNAKPHLLYVVADASAERPVQEFATSEPLFAVHGAYLAPTVIMWSADDGTTWHAASGDSTGTGPQLGAAPSCHDESVSVAPSAPRILYLACYNMGAGATSYSSDPPSNAWRQRLYVSHDSGATWQVFGPLLPSENATSNAALDNKDNSGSGYFGSPLDPAVAFNVRVYPDSTAGPTSLPDSETVSVAQTGGSSWRLRHVRTHLFPYTESIQPLTGTAPKLRHPFVAMWTVNQGLVEVVDGLAGSMSWPTRVSQGTQTLLRGAVFGPDARNLYLFYNVHPTGSSTFVHDLGRLVRVQTVVRGSRLRTAGVMSLPAPPTGWQWASFSAGAWETPAVPTRDFTRHPALLGLAQRCDQSGDITGTALLRYSGRL